MKIKAIEANRRQKAFLIQAKGAEYSFPFAKLRVEPTTDDPVEEVFPDPELGGEAFTYRLVSGMEDTVHLDAVREFSRDPEYLHELFVHQLTIEARRGLEESGLGKRQVSRQLGTSASQLYRLLDPSNRKKSIGQMLALLHLVDREVKLVVTQRSRVAQTAAQEALMAKKKVTRKKAAQAASKTLKSKATGKKSKSAAGSALSQRKAPKKTTGKKAASAASKTLRDGRTSKTSKSAAGSALSQRKKKGGAKARKKTSKK